MFAALAISGGFFVAAGLTGTAWENPLRITIYAVIAVSVIALAASHAMLIYRDAVADDRAPFWLVAITYAFGCLGLTVVAVFTLVTARILGFAGGQSAENDYSGGLLEQVMYGGIGGTAVALLLAAASFAYGLRTHQIRRRIPATPLAALKEIFKRSKQ